MLTNHTIVLATHNQDKINELVDVLRDLPLHLLTLSDFPEIGKIEETGSTLLENSRIKARTVHRLTNLPAIADDTGLEVDVLNGAPGVRSARYAGEAATYTDNVNKLLNELLAVPPPERTAQFRAVISFIDEDRELWTEGVIKGMITEKIKGNGGFGYDPVFQVPSLQKTFAELSREEKNKISHRGIALRKMRQLLDRTIFQQSIAI